jgi:hypothetical protein
VALRPCNELKRGIAPECLRDVLSLSNGCGVSFYKLCGVK